MRVNLSKPRFRMRCSEPLVPPGIAEAGPEGTGVIAAGGRAVNDFSGVQNVLTKSIAPPIRTT